MNKMFQSGTQACTNCSAIFEVTDSDLEFIATISPEFGGKKYTIPAPTKCPACRQQQRLAFRNLRSLHHRKCDLTGQQIISCYNDDIPHKVYHSDEWDGLEYGADFDFNRPFFEQFEELYKKVPLLHQYVITSENCEYINGASGCKNCYLSSDMDNTEDCYYVHIAVGSKDCIDCLNVISCELCYECVDCQDCYNVQYSQRSKNCQDSYFLADCTNCKKCIGCSNLNNKEYHVFNKPVSKEVFEQYEQDLAHRNNLGILQQQSVENNLKTPKKYYFGHSNEHSTGNIISNCQNAVHCFECMNVENLKYCRYVYDSNNCMDMDVYGDGSEWIYNAQATGTNCSNCALTMFCWSGCSNVYYSHLTSGCQDCFGCCSLVKKQYCIFNKQYTKEEYEQLVLKIIEHMKSTGEWGEFFPISMSPYGYNESISYDYYPLTKQEAFDQGCKWHDGKQEQYMGPAFDYPHTIVEVQDDICEQILTCSISGKQFKIIPQELMFYRKHNIPLPTVCPDERNKRRMSLRNPLRLWNRECDKCSTPIESSYQPGRPEIVYCEACYLAEVY